MSGDICSGFQSQGESPTPMFYHQCAMDSPLVQQLLTSMASGQHGSRAIWSTYWYMCTGNCRTWTQDTDLETRPPTVARLSKSVTQDHMCCVVQYFCKFYFVEVSYLEESYENSELFDSVHWLDRYDSSGLVCIDMEFPIISQADVVLAKLLI